MRTAALSHVSDKKEDLHQIFIGILPRGLACWSTGGKQNHGVNFTAETDKSGPALNCSDYQPNTADSAHSFKQSANMAAQHTQAATRQTQPATQSCETPPCRFTSFPCLGLALASPQPLTSHSCVSKAEKHPTGIKATPADSRLSGCLMTFA